MKKLISLLFVFIMSFSLMAPQTLGVDSAPVTFLESTENLQALKSMSIQQNISGNFEFTPAENEKMSGQFQLGFDSDVVNKGNLKSDISADITGRINLHYEGTEVPFQNLTAYLKLEIKSIVNDGVYVRLQQLHLNATSIPENEMNNYLKTKTQLEKGVKTLKGHWIYFPSTLIEEGLKMGAPEGLVIQEEIREQIAQKGLKDTYKKLFSDYLISSGVVDGNESKKLNTILDKFLETDFFTHKKVTNGLYKDFDRFNFSKRRFVQFIQWVGQELGEKLSAKDLSELNQALSKFYFSGAYHIDNQNRIFDQIRLKLILKGIEALKKAQFGMFYKISDVNKVEAITTPDNFTDYEELDFENLLY